MYQCRSVTKIFFSDRSGILSLVHTLDLSDRPSQTGINLFDKPCIMYVCELSCSDLDQPSAKQAGQWKENRDQLYMAHREYENHDYENHDYENHDYENHCDYQM